MNNKTQIKLEEIELLRCPLCGNEVSSQKYTQAMIELRNKVEKMYSTELQKQKVEYHDTINQIKQAHELQLLRLKEFYTDQNEILKKELFDVNNKQLIELKQGYEKSIKNQKEQFESSGKEMEKRFNEELE